MNKNNISRVVFDAWHVHVCFAWAQVKNELLFSFKFAFKFVSLYKLYKTNNECYFIRVMEQIFSFGERWNVPFNSALPPWIEQ